MTELELALWPFIEIAAFGFVAFCLWFRWKAQEKSTFVLLAAVALGSAISAWMMGTNTPTLNWAYLDLAAGAMLYGFRSKVVQEDHPGLERSHATIIFIFAVMALTHLVYAASTQAGASPGSLVYGRTLMILTYLQLLIVWLAERGRAYDQGHVMGNSWLGRAGAYLLAPVDHSPAGRSRGQ